MGRRPNDQQREPYTHIYQSTVDGKWHAYVKVGVKSNGQMDRRHRKSRDRETLVKAVLALEDKVAENNVPQIGLVPKFKDWLVHWHKNIAPLTADYKTLESYQSAIKHYLIPRLGDWRLSALKTRMFTALYSELEAEGNLSTSTILFIHRTAHAALNKAVTEEEISTNPATHATKPELREEAVVPLQRSEVRSIIDTVAGCRNDVRWWFAFLGLRQGEVLGLKWADIDFETGIVTIRRKAQRRSYQHGCATPRKCASRHCTPRDGCDQMCKYRRWEHGCADPIKCASVHCGRPLYASEAKRGQTQKVCPPSCKGHAKACPQKQRSICSRKSHQTGCQDDCAGHARHCPQRVGGLMIEEVASEEIGEKRQVRRRGRGRRKSTRDLRPKSAAGNRRVAAPVALLDQLRKHQERQERGRQLAGSQWQETGLIFTTLFGGQIDPHDDWEEWGRILDTAGVEYIELHGARHSAATFYLELGIDPVVAMAILGWASPEMAKRYQHVPNEILIDTAERMGMSVFDNSV